MNDVTSPRDRPPTIAVFGGSFDPPHLGHTLLVAFLRAHAEVDQVMVAPVFDHPLRKGTRTPFARRLAWTRAAMRMHGDFVRVTELEAELAAADPDRPSYSLRLLDAVAQRNPGCRVRLVIGSDIVARGETARWHAWDVIESRYTPLVVPRAGFSDANLCALPEVSSSQVRAAIGRADWSAVRAMTPTAVFEQLRAPAKGTMWVIGHGHVATHAVPWLVERGYDVEQIGGRALVSGSVRWPTASPAGVWILTTDGAVAEVARALADAGRVPSGTPVFHGAGARSSAALLSVLRPRHPVGSLHPICALRRERPWPSLLGDATFGLEGDPDAASFLEGLVDPQPFLRLGGLDEEARVAYHGACALAANHLSVLEARAEAVLHGQGHPPGSVNLAIRTLMRSALQNLQALGIPDGVTGPMSRGDIAAVGAHLNALDARSGALYRALSDELGELLKPG